MTIYINRHKDSPFRSVEYTTGASGNLCFFHIDASADKERAKQWLASTGGQEIISETVDGQQALVVSRSGISVQDLLKAFEARGEQLQELVVEKTFNPWKWRGITSIVGQSLQLLSSFTTVPKDPTQGRTSGDNAAIFGFASTNLLANIVNISVGSQKKSDPHQLRILKEEFNKKLALYLPQGETLPDVEDKRAALRQEPEKTTGQKTKELVRKYSVSGGEIGLRFFGAANLSFPVTGWGKGARALRSGKSLGDALDEVKNNNSVTYKVGLITLLGKVISFGSKEPDPFNPNPPSLLDKIREKVTFRLSSVVEAVGAAWMMVDRYKNQTIKVGHYYKGCDWFGAIGNAVFIGGYAIRFFAPYGSLEVNMKELNAHISDGLAKMPRAKLPDLLAETSLGLQHYFKDKKLAYGEIYTQLANDLKQHHGIDVLLAPVAPPEEASARIFAKDIAQKSLRPEGAANFSDRQQQRQHSLAPAGIAS